MPQAKLTSQNSYVRRILYGQRPQQIEATHMAEDKSRFPARIEIRAPAEFSNALNVAARREMTTPSSYARRAILTQLRADGITIDQPEAA
jgi:hypothetical protein